MIPKIENRTYAYQGHNLCTIAATLNIYDGTKIVASTGLSAEYNIKQLDFATEITRQLTTRVTEFLGKLAEIEALRVVHFPTSINFDSAVNQIFDPIQTAIGG